MSKKVFISYSRKDFQKVSKIVRDLESKTDIECWMDLDGIESDEANFVRVICQAIDQAELVLFFVSKTSMKSRWTIREVDYARNTGKPVVPVIFDGSKLEGEFLFEFGRSNVTDINDGLQYRKLCNYLKDLTKSSAECLSIGRGNDSSQDDSDDFGQRLTIDGKSKKGRLIKVAVIVVLFVGLLVYWLANKESNVQQFGEVIEGLENTDNKVQSSANTFDVNDETYTVEGVSFTMVGVKGGTFTMGGTSEQGKDAFEDEKPVRSVTLSSYHIGKTEVTQELWEAVMGNNPSSFKGAKRPVENVSWNDCQEFLRKLNAMTGNNFRLPTEAEWEFAARGGCKSRNYKYSGSNSIDNVCWYTNNSGSSTHDVATKSPNELGVYDMSGNVYEWCGDWYEPYSSSSQTNPRGAVSGASHVDRGGSWSDNPWSCRVSDRDDNTSVYTYNDLGLRLAM